MEMIIKKNGKKKKPELTVKDFHSALTELLSNKLLIRHDGYEYVLKYPIPSDNEETKERVICWTNNKSYGVGVTIGMNDITTKLSGGKWKTIRIEKKPDIEKVAKQIAGIVNEYRKLQ